jgi:hypothetical protein
MDRSLKHTTSTVLVLVLVVQTLYVRNAFSHQYPIIWSVLTHSISNQGSSLRLDDSKPPSSQEAGEPPAWSGRRPITSSWHKYVPPGQLRLALGPSLEKPNIAVIPWLYKRYKPAQGSRGRTSETAILKLALRCATHQRGHRKCQACQVLLPKNLRSEIENQRYITNFQTWEELNRRSAADVPFKYTGATAVPSRAGSGAQHSGADAPGAPSSSLW